MSRCLPILILLASCSFFAQTPTPDEQQKRQIRPNVASNDETQRAIIFCPNNEATICKSLTIGSGSATVLVGSAELRSIRKQVLAGRLTKKKVAERIRFNGFTPAMTEAESEKYAEKLMRLSKTRWAEGAARFGIVAGVAGLIYDAHILKQPTKTPASEDLDDNVPKHAGMPPSQPK